MAAIADGEGIADVGGQRLALDYRGPNHAEGNFFIQLPRRRRRLGGGSAL